MNDNSAPRKIKGKRVRAHIAWDAMKQRCLNKNHINYKNYGARGIAVCERWLSYDNFYHDMGNPEHGYTLDRTDNNKGYSLNNCTWATWKQQANNKRNNHYLTYKNETKTLQQWGEKLGLKPNTILTRIRRGWSITKALCYSENESIKRRQLISEAFRERSCIGCGSTFYPRITQIKYGNGKYCSKKCSVKVALKVRWNG